MKVYIDCVHCYLRQAVTCMEMANLGEDKQHEILYKIMDYVKTFDRNRTPCYNSSLAILKTYNLMNIDDPYKKAKKLSNDLALKLYPRLEKILAVSEDTLFDALKISVAGNIIDLGVNRNFNIEESLNHAVNTGFSLNDYKLFIQKLKNVGEILIIGDNSGEIVFDKILVEQLVCMGKKVTYAVNESPILNDATMDDARYVGMDKIAKIVTNGSNFLGTSLEKVSSQFVHLIEKSNLIISKGQANYESLEHTKIIKNKTFFLLKIKCDGVGKSAGAKFSDVVFLHK